MSIYDENNVPILYRPDHPRLGISEEGLAALDEARAAAIEAFDAAAGDPEKLAAAYDEHHLLGESVLVDNRDPDRADYTTFVIGASTLDEAVKEVIAGFDTAHVGEPDQPADHLFTPGWVTSTHPELAQHLADYYSATVRDIAEVL